MSSTKIAISTRIVLRSIDHHRRGPGQEVGATMIDLGINLDGGTYLAGEAALEDDLISRGPHLSEEEADLEANIVIVARTGPHHVPSN